MKLITKGFPICTECKLGVIKNNEREHGYGVKIFYICDRCESEFENN